MAKQRMMNTKFWSDSWVKQELNPLDRYLFIYFLTNEHTSICGIYEIPIEIIAFETGLKINELNSSYLPRLKPKILYKNNYIIIPNFIKHQKWSSPKVITGIRAEISHIPRDIIDFAIRYGYDINTISHLNLNSNSNSNSKGKNLINKKTKELAKLLYELILKNDKGYPKPNWDVWYKDMDKINRIDKRSFDLIEKVIRWVRNDDFWMKNVFSPSKLRKQFGMLVVKANLNNQTTNEEKMNLDNIIKRWSVKDQYNWYELCLTKQLDWIPYFKNKRLLVQNGKILIDNNGKYKLFNHIDKNMIDWLPKDKLKLLD